MDPGPAGPAGNRHRRHCHRWHDGQLHGPGSRAARGTRTTWLGRRGYGLQGAPHVTAIVGEGPSQHHRSRAAVSRPGAPTVVACDGRGRIRIDALAQALAATDGPLLVALQAGEIHSGAFDDFDAAIGLVHDRGGWVHVDGAFGLWAGASEATRHLVRGYERADSWATDCPQDPQRAVRLRPGDRGRSGGPPRGVRVNAPYLIQSQGAPDPFELTRSFPAGPGVRAVGDVAHTGPSRGVGPRRRTARQRRRSGRRRARDGWRGAQRRRVHPGLHSMGDDETTAAVERELVADGQTWMTGSTWHDRRVLRIAVSNWATDAEQVGRTLEALDRARRAAGFAS